MSRNALMYFAYADFEEGRLKYEKVHQIYNKFLSIQDIDPTLVRDSRDIKREIVLIFNLFRSTSNT